MTVLETLCVFVLLAFAGVGAIAIAVLGLSAVPGALAQWAQLTAAVLVVQSLAAWAQTLCMAAGFLLLASLISKR